MDYGDHVDAVERALAELIEAVDGPMDAAVPSCPGFTVADLSLHIGEFSGFWTHVLCEGLGIDKTPSPEPPADGSWPRWLEAYGGHLVETLRSASPDTPCWTWHPPLHRWSALARNRCSMTSTVSSRSRRPTER